MRARILPLVTCALLLSANWLVISDLRPGVSLELYYFLLGLQIVWAIVYLLNTNRSRRKDLISFVLSFILILFFAWYQIESERGRAYLDALGLDVEKLKELGKSNGKQPTSTATPSPASTP